MAEVVYIAASMRAPIVMAVGNRALSGPINIHCDHSDSMLIRDSGVVQLFAENAQEAYDLTVLRRESPSIRPCCCRCSSAWMDSRSRTRPSPLSSSRTTRFTPSSATTAFHTRSSTSATRTRTGRLRCPDHYFELRRQQAAALDAAGPALAEAAVPFGMTRAAGLRPRSSAYRLDGAARRSSRSARPQAPSRRRSMSCARRESVSACCGSARSVRSQLLMSRQCLKTSST